MTGETLGHEDAAALLPWLANGTLEGEERERVERHVRQCLPCRAELAEQRALQTLVRRQPVVRVSAEGDFERLRRRLDGAPPTGRSRITGRALWAAAAAVVLAMVWIFAPAVLERTASPSAGYRTLSQEVRGDALIDVIFAEGVQEAEMRALLAELGAEIIGGPSPGLGRYTLRVRDEAGRPVDVDTVVRRLLGDERVRFAGRAFSLPDAGSAYPPSEQRGQ